MTIAACTVALAVVAAWTVAKEGKGAVLRVDRFVVDVGEVTQGLILKQAFYLTNTGNRPLTIGGVAADCYCTIADFPENALAPGDSRELSVSVRTSALPAGAFLRRVRVRSNDQSMPTTTLTIKGWIKAEFRPSATTIDFGTAPLSAKRMRILRIEVLESQARIFGVESTDPSVTAAIENMEGSDGVLIRLIEVQNQPGWHSGLILVQTGSAALPIIRIPVRGFLTPLTSARSELGGHPQQR